MDYLSRIHARARGEEKGVPGYLHDKLKAVELVKSIKVSTPRTHQVVKHPSHLRFDSLPYHFVLKPTFSSSSYGVMVLQRYLDRFHDHLRDRDLTVDEILDEQVRLMEKHPKANHHWVVEDKVEDAEGHMVPDDYKFYGFQGQIGLVHRTIRDSPKNRHIYYNGDFEPFDQDETLITTLPQVVVREHFEPPANAAQLLSIARQISLVVPSPFVRIDMYNTPSGPVFGEFTLVPGTFFYEDRERLSPELSKQLGRLWDDAEKWLRTT